MKNLGGWWGISKGVRAFRGRSFIKPREEGRQSAGGEEGYDEVGW